MNRREVTQVKNTERVTKDTPFQVVAGNMVYNAILGRPDSRDGYGLFYFEPGNKVSVQIGIRKSLGEQRESREVKSIAIANSISNEETTKYQPQQSGVRMQLSLPEQAPSRQNCQA